MSGRRTLYVMATDNTAAHTKGRSAVTLKRPLPLQLRLLLDPGVGRDALAKTLCARTQAHGRSGHHQLNFSVH